MKKKSKHSSKVSTKGHKMYGSEGDITAHHSTQGRGKDHLNDHMHTMHNKAHGLPGDMFGHDGDAYNMGHGKELTHAHESEVTDGDHTAYSSMAHNATHHDAPLSGKSVHNAPVSEDDEEYEND